MKLALNDDLCCYSYKRHRGQLLTENSLTKGKKLLSKYKHPVEPQTGSFPMRKTFSKINGTTCRIIDGLHTVKWTLLVVMQTKFPQAVMVLGCVSCERDVMPPRFFRDCLRLISDAYVEMLITVVKPWITRVGHMYGNKIRPPATPLGEVKNCWQIFTTTPVPMFGLRTPQILNL